MTQPMPIGGRPAMPPPGSVPEERLISRFRGHGGRLFWSALILIGVAGAVPLFWGNLPTPFEDWMLAAAAALVILVMVITPFTRWASRRYTVTTKRVMARSGFSRTTARELSHARGYNIAVRRGLIQRLSGSGTISLTNGVDAPLVLTNVPDVSLVHETLADQIEVNQILAHRGTQGTEDFGESPV